MKAKSLQDYHNKSPFDEEFAPFNSNWKPAKHERGVVYSGPWEDPHGGFSDHVRRCAKALSEAGMPVLLRSSGGGLQLAPIDPNSSNLYAHDVASKIRNEYDELLTNSIGSVLVEINQFVPRDAFFQKIVNHRYLDPKQIESVNRYRILSTVWERDRASQPVVNLMNKVGQCWVATPYDKEMLINSGVLEDKLRVVPIPFWPNDPLLALEGRKRQPGPVRFYHIGKWEPRKAQDNILLAFLLAFKPGEASLYLKTSRTAPPFGGGYPQSAAAAMHACLNDERIKGKWTLDDVNRNVFIIQDFLDDERLRALHRSGDVYVSLSRGEGFDMPMYDAKLAGNLAVYTPSGGPQSFAGSDDVCVEPNGKIPCHPFYRWSGDAHCLDYDVEVAAAAMRTAAAKIRDGIRTRGIDLSPFSAEAVGKNMLKYINEVCEAR